MLLLIPKWPQENTCELFTKAIYCSLAYCLIMLMEMMILQSLWTLENCFSKLIMKSLTLKPELLFKFISLKVSSLLLRYIIDSQLTQTVVTNKIYVQVFGAREWYLCWLLPSFSSSYCDASSIHYASSLVFLFLWSGQHYIYVLISLTVSYI